MFVKVDFVMRSPFAASSTRGIIKNGDRDELLSADEKMPKSADQAAHTIIDCTYISVSNKRTMSPRVHVIQHIGNSRFGPAL